MMKSNSSKMQLAASLAVAATLAFACGAEGQGTSSPAPAGLAPEARAQAQTSLREYERIRAALAADDGQVADAATALATAADAAASGAPANLRTHLSSMARDARELARVPASDLPALRRQFGNVSRSVLATLHMEPSLGRGLHAFECPMAEGYGRWVQPSADISNPYMGTRMPACGGPAAMEPD